jgi:hypothetical protein
VTGLCIVGNQASIVGRFVGAQPFGTGFPTAFVLVQDNGTPSKATRDLALVTAFSNAAPDPCALFGFASFMRPLVRGNITVRDRT